MIDRTRIDQFVEDFKRFIPEKYKGCMVLDVYDITDDAFHTKLTNTDTEESIVFKIDECEFTSMEKFGVESEMEAIVKIILVELKGANICWQFDKQSPYYKKDIFKAFYGSEGLYNL